MVRPLRIFLDLKKSYRWRRSLSLFRVGSPLSYGWDQDPAKDLVLCGSYYMDPANSSPDPQLCIRIYSVHFSPYRDAIAAELNGKTKTFEGKKA